MTTTITQVTLSTLTLTVLSKGVASPMANTDIDVTKVDIINLHKDNYTNMGGGSSKGDEEIVITMIR
jgi:hypothetical protein